MVDIKRETAGFIIVALGLIGMLFSAIFVGFNTLSLTPGAGSLTCTFVFIFLAITFFGCYLLIDKKK
jgi:hypothetical protein